MRIIDSHVHIGIFHFGYLDGMTGVLKNYEKFISKKIIEGAVIMTTDNRNNKEVEEKIKQSFFRSKLFFFYWVNPKNKNDFNIINSSKIEGFKIHPTVDKKSILDSSYDKYLDYAEKKKLPIIIHCGQWQEIASYKFALERAKQYPKINFILAHMGGSSTQYRLETAYALKRLKFKNVSLDISGSLEYWTTQKCIRNILNANYYIFGSDYPLTDPRITINLVKNLGLKKQDEEKIFYGNIMRILTKK